MGLGTSACSSQSDNSSKQLLVSQRSLSKRPMEIVVKVQANDLEKI